MRTAPPVRAALTAKYHVRMLRAAFGVTLALLAASVHARDSDPRVRWLAANAVRIDTAKGLEQLRGALQGVRVVMLGEQTHHDGSTSVAKTRLIRFLHEQMGFDVLAFESGLYDCAKAWELLSNGEPARTAVPRGVFSIWTSTREVQSLLDYIGERAKTNRPLELAGVDSQLTGSASADFLTQDLQAYLSRLDPDAARGEDWDRVARVIRHLYESAWELKTEPIPSASEQIAFARTIERWRSLIAARDQSPATQPWSGPFWRQFLDSLRVNAEQNWRDVFAMRDQQMGENLIWLAKERYPNRRIIVWAATFHNARRLGTIDTASPKLHRLYAGITPMGEVAYKALGSEVYSIGFVSFEGGKLPRARKDSLEDLLARAGHESAFVDFRNAPDWLRTTISARLLGYEEMRADWTRVVDGVVFLRTLKPATRGKSK